MPLFSHQNTFTYVGGGDKITEDISSEEEFELGKCIKFYTKNYLPMFTLIPHRFNKENITPEFIGQLEALFHAKKHSEINIVFLEYPDKCSKYEIETHFQEFIAVQYPDQAYRINEYLTLKLKNGKTKIYVAGEKFRQCKFLLLNLSKDKIETYDTIRSIDEAEEELDTSLEHSNISKYAISPKEEFWGHCSNLQVWYERQYDTRLLHRNLAFPLLKRLSKVGDVLAQRVFKEEIISRTATGTFNVVKYLLTEDFLKIFNPAELQMLSDLIPKPILIKLWNEYVKEMSYRQRYILRKLIQRSSLLYVLQHFKFVHKHDAIIEAKDRILIDLADSSFEIQLLTTYRYYKLIPLTEFPPYVQDAEQGHIILTSGIKVSVKLFLSAIELLVTHPEIPSEYHHIYAILPCEVAPFIFFSTQSSFKIFIAPLEKSQ